MDFFIANNDARTLYNSTLNSTVNKKKAQAAILCYKSSRFERGGRLNCFPLNPFLDDFVISILLPVSFVDCSLISDFDALIADLLLVRKLTELFFLSNLVEDFLLDLLEAVVSVAAESPLLPRSSTSLSPDLSLVRGISTSIAFLLNSVSSSFFCLSLSAKKLNI